MTTHPRLYLDALELCTGEVARAADSLGLESACSQWRIGQVVRHCIEVQAREALPVLRGGERDPDAAAPEPHEMSVVDAWEQLALELHAAATAASDAALERVRLPALDLAMHAWDIRFGLWRVGLAPRLEFPPAVLAWMEAYRARADESRIRAAGVLGPAQPAPPGSTASDALMAWAGRRIPAPR